MSDFKWQTEEEWDEVWEAPRPSAPSPRNRRRWWLVLGLLVVGLMGGFYAVYWRVNQQIEAAVAEAKADVVATHELVVQAAIDSDDELFVNLLSGRDPNWTLGQSVLLRQRLLFNRPAWGLQTVDIRAAPPDIALNPDLDEANFAREIAYEDVETGEMVRWRHTAVYRRGAERWLLAPQTDPRWTTNNIFEGSFVDAQYPQADAEYAERVIRDLEAMLDAICSGFYDVACAPQLRLGLEFSLDPSSLNQMMGLAVPPPINVDEVTGIIENSDYFLPTPAIVGLPIDEAGYEVLLRGYARYVLGEVLARSLEEYWLFTDELQSLARVGRGLQLGLERDVPHLHPDIPNPPAQGVSALCYGEEGVQLSWMDVATGEVEVVEDDEVLVRLIPEPEDAYAAVVEVINNRAVVNFWQPDEAMTALFSLPDMKDGNDVEWRSHPQLPRLVLPNSNRSESENESPSIVVEFEAGCDTPEGCDFTFLPAQEGLSWSPDGSQTLMSAVGEDNMAVMLGDEVGKITRFLGSGLRPLWVDEARYLYLAPWREERILMEGNLEAGGVAIRLTQTDMLAAVPADLRPDWFAVAYLAKAPQAEKYLLLGFPRSNSGNNAEWGAYFFSYDGVTGELQTVLIATQVHSALFSPHGRYLQAFLFDTERQAYTLELHEIATQEVRRFPLEANTFLEADWSADGEWLLALDNGRVLLIRAATGEHYTIAPYKYPTCFDAVWLDK